VAWKQHVNAALRRTTGYELTKPGPRAVRRRRLSATGDRLLTAPVFVISSVRSGSTLLRVLLDSHSQVYAPHEIHLRNVGVRVNGGFTQRSLEEFGLDRRELQHLLWDRILHRELEQSGKRIFVNKTPGNVFMIDRILECWPDARFIFLLRHPAAITKSRQQVRPRDDAERNLAKIVRYCEAVQAAREAHSGHEVRYEDLTADPEVQTQRLCAFLGVPWEPAMLDYAAADHGRYRRGIGDWNEKLRSGRIHVAPPPPPVTEVPPSLRGIAAQWGYRTEATPVQSGGG
jgi:Sulfotransferase family